MRFGLLVKGVRGRGGVGGGKPMLAFMAKGNRGRRFTM